MFHNYKLDEGFDAFQIVENLNLNYKFVLEFLGISTRMLLIFFFLLSPACFYFTAHHQVYFYKLFLHEN